MHTFTDAAGRAWSVVINVNAAKRVRDLLRVDLVRLIDDELRPLDALIADPVALVDLLYVLCKPQADADKLSDEDFGRAMYGDAIERAAGAFLGELTDFFPNARMRAALKDVLAKGERAKALLIERLEANLAAADPEAIVRALTGSSGSSPASSAPTPGP